MSRYIDADAVLKEIEELKKSPWYNDDYGFGTKQARQDGVGVVVDLCIKQAPTADVVEVVRCKDCKHCEQFPLYKEKGKESKLEYICCAFGNVSPDFYCGIGERREE